MQVTVILLLLFVSNGIAKIGDRDPTTETSPVTKPDVTISTTIAPPSTTSAPTTPATSPPTSPPTTPPGILRNASLTPTILGGRTYFFTKNQLTTWLDALQFCRVFGMDLASVETAEENSLLQGHLADLGIKDSYVAISGHKIGRDDYIWANGAPVDNKIGWAPGEPAQFSTENCMIMWRGFWYDLPCHAYMGYFICEQSP